jgi:hypothetical protein
VPGHAGLVVNEVADAEARSEGLEDYAETPVDFASAKAAIKEEARQRMHARFEETLDTQHHYRVLLPIQTDTV